jgi:phosphohistidine phosphatase
MNRPGTLLLLRHGKSDWQAGACDDFSRPLSKRGKKASRRIGAWLLENGLLPDRIISAPATRAYQTAEYVCEVSGMSGSVLGTDKRLYLADVGSLLDIIHQCPSAAGSLMIVGHNPGLEELLEYLCADPPPETENGKLMPTATLAVLKLNGAWNELGAGSAHLHTLTRPRQPGE